MKSVEAASLAGFYPILVERQELTVVDAAEAILEGGARILQFRYKAFFSRPIFEHMQRIAEMCRIANALFVVNDRADMAMLLGAAVHLGQDDLPPAAARSIMPPGAIIGFSTHNEQQLRDADREAVDYLAVGPIFGTSSKENPDATVGVEELRRLRPLTKKPVVAIGGITRANARSVFEAGGDMVAVISDLYPEPCTKATLRERTEEWLQLCKRGPLLASP